MASRTSPLPATDPCAPFPWPLRTYPGKRAADVVAAAMALVVAAPVMLATALGVKLTSRGPVLYHGPRVGLGGRPFQQLKFRTMVVDADRRGAFTGLADRRVTPLGRLLRLVKIDELPQLVNVLRGEMSVVGPRPEDATVVRELYSVDDLRVLSVRPGLTCLVQVRHFPDFSREIPPGVDPNEFYRTDILPARLREDLEYVDRQSLALDLAIILRTIYCILIKSWLIVPWRGAPRRGQ